MGPLLETKFHIPTRRGTRTTRPRLSNRAVEVARASLTLVSAPAGFGKTTLLTEWMESLPDGVARSWLSLDSQDNDPVQLWMYVVAAIRKAVGDQIGSGSVGSAAASSSESAAASHSPRAVRMKPFLAMSELGA